MASASLLISPDEKEKMIIIISETNACICTNTSSSEQCVIHSSTHMIRAVIENLWHEGWKVKTLASF